MPPIRKYLRITKYSVLEVRIHLDNPVNISWLLQGNKAALPRIIEAIRPLILPKLREEKEKARSKSSTKKKVIQELVARDDFEVSIFIDDSPARHSVLQKSKTFLEPKQPKNMQNWLGGKDGSNPDNAIRIREETPEDENFDDNPVVESEDKKLIPKTDYEGFSIYGRYICLFVKRKGTQTLETTIPGAKSSHEMMENWIATQVAAD